MAAELKHHIGISYSKITAFFGTYFDLHVSHGTPVRAERRLSRTARPSFDLLVEELRACGVVHFFSSVRGSRTSPYRIIRVSSPNAAGRREMINVDTENLITFSQLARRLPRRRKDRPVHVSTIHRWRFPGVNGVQLEAVRVGGCWCTSHEAFVRFTAELTRQAQTRQAQSAAPTGPDRPHPDVVDDALDALGI